MKTQFVLTVYIVILISACHFKHHGGISPTLYDSIYQKLTTDTLCYHEDTEIRTPLFKVKIESLCSIDFNDSMNKEISIRLMNDRLRSSVNFNNYLIEHMDKSKDTLQFDYYFISSPEESYSLKSFSSKKDTLFISLRSNKPQSMIRRESFHLIKCKLLFSKIPNNPLVVIK